MASYCVALFDLTNKEIVNRQLPASTRDHSLVLSVFTARSLLHLLTNLFARLAELHTLIHTSVPPFSDHTDSTNRHGSEAAIPLPSQHARA